MQPELSEATPRIQPTLLLARNARRTGSEAHLRRLYTSGQIIRLRTGVYLNAAEWATAVVDDQYRFRVRAAAAMIGTETQFSHDSAAVMWGLPTLGPWSR